MSRAVLLPMPGDPFILANFINNFENIWRDEVDMLYVLLNVDHRMPQNIVDFDKKFLNNRPKVKYLYTNEMLFQGKALRFMLPHVEEDLIMSIEDDTVIVKRGEIDKCFRKLEKNEADVIGSPRACCSKQILDACQVKWNLDYSGYGDKGPTYWPNFFFCRKSDLLRTDLHFEPIGWSKGTYVKELNITAEEDLAGDVFVWLCIQLRDMGLRFYDVPQYHSRPTDLVDITLGQNLGDVNCGWVHIGSLTMTAEDLLMGINDPKDHVNKPSTEQAKKEMERRYAWLKVFLDTTVPQTIELDKERALYEKRINDYISAFNLSVFDIDNLSKVYRRFITW